MATLYTPPLYSLSILLSTVPLYNPQTHPTKISSLHSHSLLPLYTPLISSSLPSASTPFSIISTAQLPLGSPMVTRQPPYITNPPLKLPFYSSSLPALCTPFLHPFSTPILYPISTTYLPTIWLIPVLHPFDILLSTICLYTLFYN